MKNDNDDYAMLEGGEPPAEQTPKPKAKKTATVKQKVRQKAEAAERKTKKEVTKKTTPRLAKPEAKPVVTPPTLNAKAYATVAALAKQRGCAMTSEELCKAATGKDDKTSRETYVKTVLSTLVKKAVVVKDADDQKKVVYRLSKDTVNLGGVNFAKLLACVPSSQEEAVSCAFIGGKAWSGKMPEGKRDLWKNVRYGRAAGAMLKRLAAVGLVGVAQSRPDSVKRYWRAA